MSRRALRPSPADLEVTERLLAGLPIDDLPAEHTAAFRDLPLALASLTAPATAEERAGVAAAAAAYVAARAPRPRRVPPRRPLARPRSPRLVAATFSSFLALSGTAFATSVDALPRPVERIAHDAFGTVGLHIGIVDNAPSGGETPSPRPDGTTPPSSGPGPAPTRH